MQFRLIYLGTTPPCPAVITMSALLPGSKQHFVALRMDGDLFATRSVVRRSCVRISSQVPGDLEAGDGSRGSDIQRTDRSALRD